MAALNISLARRHVLASASPPLADAIINRAAAARPHRRQCLQHIGAGRKHCSLRLTIFNTQSTISERTDRRDRLSRARPHELYWRGHFAHDFAVRRSTFIGLHRLLNDAPSHSPHYYRLRPQIISPSPILRTAKARNAGTMTDHFESYSRSRVKIARSSPADKTELVL
jgi:hypothetical protein